MTRAGQVKELPQIAAAAGKPPLNGHIAPDQRKIELEASSEDSEGSFPRRIRDRIAEGMPPLPDGALKVGQSFEAKVPLELPGPGGQGDNHTDSVWTYTLKALTDAEALFDVRQTLPEGARITTKSGRTISISGGAKGTASFNRTEGMFAALKMDADYRVVLDLPAAGVTGAPSKGDAGPAQLKTNVQGPMVMTLTRIAAPR
jgi:hypothetical protein